MRLLSWLISLTPGATSVMGKGPNHVTLVKRRGNKKEKVRSLIFLFFLSLMGQKKIMPSAVYVLGFDQRWAGTLSIYLTH
jgi:hypothetical protein